MLGPNFPKHICFQFKVHDKVHDSLDSRWVSGSTIGAWIHDGFLDSRWIPGFALDSWILAGFWDEMKAARSAALNF